MKHRTFLTTAFLVGTLAFPPLALSQEEDVLAKEEIASVATKDRPEWVEGIKNQYKLTDAQIQTMKDKGISYPQMAMTANLAEKSGKSIDDILKMRTEDKMGWGKIAKELGVPPKEIGQSVSGLRHEMKLEKHEAKMENKLERKLERKEARMERKLEKQAQKREKKEGHKNH